MELEWVIYHLIHNDDENFTSIIDLDIDLCRSDEDQWNRLLLGLSRNRTIQSIELLRGYQNPIITEDDLRKLFTALRCCTKLSKVKLDSFTINDLEQTESLFKNNTLIEEVWIENAHFQRDDDDDNDDDDDDDDGMHSNKRQGVIEILDDKNNGAQLLDSKSVKSFNAICCALFDDTQEYGGHLNDIMNIVDTDECNNSLQLTIPDAEFEMLLNGI
jgi:hypothetical protein